MRSLSLLVKLPLYRLLSTLSNCVSFSSQFTSLNFHQKNVSKVSLSLQSILLLVCMQQPQISFTPTTMIKTLFSLLILSLLYTNSISRNLNSTETICPWFRCGEDEGDVTIGYPFWENSQGTAKQYCGYPQFGLTCSPEGETILKLPGDGKTHYYVKDINYKDQTLTLVDADVVSSDCPRVRQNISLGSVPLNYSPSNLYLGFYFNCTKPPYATLSPIDCLGSGSDGRRTYVSVVGGESDGYDWACEEKVVTAVMRDQINVDDLIDTFGGAMKEGFVLKWRTEKEEKCGTCEKNGGRCAYNATHFLCFCKNDNVSLNQCKGNPINWRVKLGIGFGAAGFTFAIMLVVFFICQRRNRKKYVAPSSYVSRNISSDYSSMSDLEKMGSYFGVHLFTYEELEEATDNFDSSKELGDGGFGTVYYGKLRDGRVVAVKRLYESNYKRVEQFMNEVEILTRLRHRHLVLLYGCTSRHSRELLLVYEYISNGTVADHLHGERAKPKSLPWPIRLKIAIETASALAYLHASDIIHRDVKTNNILLDDHFCVKVADFGLSRLFPTDVTHISTAPQGTPGYVDPDYHQCYQLTDKSDVYSFGVVLIELISSKPAVDITRHRHEINLSNMAINKIQNRELHELVDPSIGFESDCTIKMMVTAVAALAFQCLQSEKDMRPTMEEVFGSLKDILQYNEKPAEEVNIPADDVEKLKSVQPPLPLSPVSVTANWVISSSSTPNGSG